MGNYERIHPYVRRRRGQGYRSVGRFRRIFCWPVPADFLLAGSGGFVDGKIIPALGETEKPSKAVIVIENNPISLVKEIFRHLTEIKKG